MRKLTNPNASPSAVRLYEYICSLQGKACLTGQMESGWCGTFEHEINYILSRTGRMPAIRGLDFINNDFHALMQMRVTQVRK